MKGILKKKKILVLLILGAAVLLVLALVRNDKEEITAPVAEEASGSFVGEYQFFRDAPNEPNLEERLSIFEDGTVIWSEEYVNSRPPAVVSGTWEEKGEEIVVEITGDPEDPYQNVQTYTFASTDKGLFEPERSYELSKISDTPTKPATE